MFCQVFLHFFHFWGVFFPLKRPAARASSRLRPQGFDLLLLRAGGVRLQLLKHLQREVLSQENQKKNTKIDGFYRLWFDLEKLWFHLGQSCLYASYKTGNESKPYEKTILSVRFEQKDWPKQVKLSQSFIQAATGPAGFTGATSSGPISDISPPGFGVIGRINEEPSGGFPTKCWVLVETLGAS